MTISVEPSKSFLSHIYALLRRVLRVLRATQSDLRAGDLLRRESLPPAPLPQVAVHRQAAHVVRARVAESQTSSQGHEGDHRAREGWATPTPRRAAAELTSLPS